MYTVEFYENDRGVSELWDFLEELRIIRMREYSINRSCCISSCCRTTEHGFPRM